MTPDFLFPRELLRHIRIGLFLLACLSLWAARLVGEPLAFMVLDDVHYAAENEYDWAALAEMQSAEASRVRRNVDRSTKTFLPLLQELKMPAETYSPKPFALFSCGDLVHGGPGVLPEAQCGNFIHQFESIRMPIPIYNANGNHEMAERGMEAAYDKIFLPFLSRQLGRPLDARHYSVTRGNSHFILLDGLPPDRDGGDHEKRIWALKDRQWAWLESELESSKARDHVFIFTHATLWPLGDGDILHGNDPERHRLLVDLLLKYNVRAIFAGHKHLNCVTVYQNNGHQLVQMIPNSDISAAPPAAPKTRTIAYTPENIVPGTKTDWDQWGRAIVTRYQAGITHHEVSPGAAGYFLVKVDGPTVTVRTYLVPGARIFREYTLTRDPATGATRFQVE